MEASSIRQSFSFQSKHGNLSISVPDFFSNDLIGFRGKRAKEEEGGEIGQP